MNYHYPPPPLPLWAETTVGIALGICLLAAWYVLWRQTAWKASGWRFVAWLLGCVLTFGTTLGMDFAWSPVSFLFPLLWGTFLSGALAALLPQSLAEPSPKRINTLLLLIFVEFVCLLLAPSIMDDREAGRRTACKNNLKQIGLAFHNYHETFKNFPQSSIGNPPHSWRIDALNFIDGGPEFVRVETIYKMDAPWDQEPNLALASKQMAVYTCPTNSNPKDSQGRWYTAYAMLTGPNTIGQSDKAVNVNDITDGLSNTIFVVEACGANIVWTEPRDIDVSERPPGVNLPGDAPKTSRGWLSSCHSGGAHMLLADGSLRFVSEKIAPGVLGALATIDGGETVEDY